MKYLKDLSDKEYFSELSLNDFASFIKYFEQKYDVLSWKYNDIDLWPIYKMRFGMYFACQRLDIYHPKTNLPKKEKNIFKRFKFISKNFLKGFDILSFFLSAFFIKRPILFLGSKCHRLIFNSKFYNKFYDPLIEFKPIKSFLQMELLAERFNSSDYYFSGRVFSYEYIRDFYNKIKRFFNKSIGVRQESLSLSPNSDIQVDCWDEMERRFVLYIKQMKKNNYQMAKEESFIRFLLKIIKPEAIFTICWYSNFFPVVYKVAKELGIKTVDIQHGVINDTHPVYVDYKIMPEDGFNSLPEYFWCWDEKTASFIKNWCECEFHKTIVGGNPWVESWKAGLIDSPTEKNNNQIILFSMSILSIRKELPDYLLESIKKTSDFLWYIRLHPRCRYSPQDVESYLKSHNVSNAKVSTDEDAYLPELLSISDLHITQQSAVVVEAQDYNLKSILLDKDCLEIFDDEIKKGKAFYLQEKDSCKLVDLIKKIKSESSKYNHQVCSEDQTVKFVSALKQIID